MLVPSPPRMAVSASVWDVDSGERRRSLKHPEIWVQSCCFLFGRPGGCMAQRRYRRGVGHRLWSLPTGSLRRELPGRGASLAGLAVRADDRLVSATGFDGAVRLWDLSTNPPRRQTFRLFPYGASWSYGVAFSPDGRHLAAGNPDGTIYLFRLTLGPSGPDRPAGVAPGPTPKLSSDPRIQARRIQGWVCASIFSPGRQADLRAGTDGDVCELDTATGEELHRLHHPNEVFDLALTPDDRLIISSCRDGIVRVWDATTGKEVRRLGDKRNPWSVTLSGREAWSSRRTTTIPRPYFST